MQRMDKQSRRNAFTLLEIMLAVIIVATVATLGIAHVRKPAADAHQNACNVHRELLQGLATRYTEEQDAAPSRDLRELVGLDYLNGTLPRCPSTAQAYELRSGVVACPTHETTR
jgi:prepilin-type N-terminal cleavage/methylation domain-containing protein